MRFLLGNVDKIFTPSTVSKNSIVSEYGASKDKIVLSIGAADPNIYLPHKRSSGVIGLVSRFSERKNPKLILQIVKKMPDVNFLLIGTRWEKSDVFDSLMSYDNFSYVDPNYEDYHSYHSNIDVYLSTSFIEGGPIPLIETMMSNIVPVVSNTGFASDVIVDGENGFLFDVYDDVDVIVRKLNSALDFDKDVSWSVEGFTWDAFVNNIQLNLDR